MFICLIRHGETDWVKEHRLQGRSDIPLNANGMNEMHSVANALGRFSWQKIIASPLSRAHKSAMIIAESLSLAGCTVDDRLIERNFGTAEGSLPSERKLPLEPQNYPGLEARECVGKRIFEAINAHAEANPGQNLIFVCHSGAIRAFISYYTQVQDFKSKSASTSILELKNNIFTPLYINLAPHELEDIEL